MKVDVVGWVNNQMIAPKPTHERRHAHMISKRTSTGNKVNFCLCKQPTKKAYN